MMDIQYRPGKIDDCKKLAELTDMASDGVVEYLFHDLIPGMSPVEIVARNFEQDQYPHTFNSAIVAVDENAVVGMTLSYPSSFHKITDEMRSFFPPERLAHLDDFFSSRIENSWYIDTLGIIASHRRRGIGEKLISLEKEKAANNGYQSLSLIVFSDNSPAISLYKKAGFETAAAVHLQRNEIIRHKDGCLLLECRLV